MDIAATNTLLIPDIPHSFFESKDPLENIKTTFEAFGHVHRFIAMKGFRRLMIIYSNTMDALRAKQTVDRQILRWTMRDNKADIVALGTSEGPSGEDLQTMEVRVYFGQHSPIDPDLANRHLQVPTLSRNFLISPPGSPFADWEQKSESPPNAAVLASGLMHALTELQDEPEDGFLLNSETMGDQAHGKSALLTIVCNSESDHSHPLPLITVQDYGSSTDAPLLTVTSSTARPPFASTARPPLSPTALPPF